MAKEPKSSGTPPEGEHSDGILASAAKAIGTAAGKIAAIAGVHEDAPPAPPKKSAKPAKLQKKNKERVPRREKKARKKMAGQLTPA